MKARDVAAELGLDAFLDGPDDGTGVADAADGPDGAAPSDAGGPGDPIAGELADELEAVQHRLDDLESAVDDNESAITDLEREQADVTERLDHVEENTATLLGIYDRLVDDVNPFSGDADAEPPDADGPYGVVPPTDDDGAEADEVVSFDDVRGTEEPDGTDRTEDAPPPAETGAVALSEDGEAYLSELPPTYATDVLLLQWTAALLDAAGTAGALEAIEYYARIGWIGRPVQRHLETLVGGADADAVDPDAERSLEEIPVEVHDRSSEHIQRIAGQHAT